MYVFLCLDSVKLNAIASILYDPMNLIFAHYILFLPAVFQKDSILRAMYETLP